MIKLLFPVLLSISCQTKPNSNTSNPSQVPNPDFLKKYSYPIYLFDEGKPKYVATCFLYETDSDTLVVSNFHVLGGYNPSSRRRMSFDSAIIKVPYKNSSDSFFMPLSLNSEIDYGIDSFYFWNFPDLLAIRPNDFNPKGVYNFTSSLIDTLYFNKIPEEVYIFGFGNSSQIFDKNLTSKTVFFRGIIYPDFSSLDSIGKLMGYDPDSLLTKQIERNYFLSSIPTEPGSSGSPVFGLFKENNKFTYKFIGVNVGNYNGIERGYMVKGSVVYNTLNQKLTNF